MWGGLTLDNPSYDRGASSRPSKPGVGDWPRVSQSRRTSPSITDATDDEDYDTAGDETPRRGTTAPRWAPSYDNSAAVVADYSASSSYSHDTSCATSSSTDPRLERTCSIASAPPWSGWSQLPPPVVRLTPTDRRSTIAGAALGPSLPPAVASPVSSGPAPSSKPPPARYPSRRPNLNRNPRPSRSLLCLSLKNPIRKLCIRIVEYKYPFISVLFLINCHHHHHIIVVYYANKEAYMTHTYKTHTQTHKDNNNINIIPAKTVGGQKSTDKKIDRVSPPL